jgi:hypothetical protein
MELAFARTTITIYGRDPFSGDEYHDRVSFIAMPGVR